MTELMPLLKPNDLYEIGAELEKLFIFQDRPLSVEKKAMLVQEIAAWGSPLEAIVMGLRSLLLEDMKSVKMALIHRAIQLQMKSSIEKEIKQKFEERAEKLRLIAEKDWENSHPEKTSGGI